MTLRCEAIILAGGAGLRFGGGKLLAPYRNGALIDGAIRTALAAPATYTLLITGHDAEAVVRRAVTVAGRDRRLEIVHAVDHAEGMAATLRAGIAALSKDTEAAFVFLGDMPDIPPQIAHRLLERIENRAAAAPVFEGRRGHPVLVARRLFPALSRLTGDKGARGVLDGLGEDLVRVPTDDPNVLFDVDQPLDLAS